MTRVTIDSETRDALYRAAVQELSAMDDVYLVLSRGEWVHARDHARRIHAIIELLDGISWQENPGDDTYTFDAVGDNPAGEGGELILLMAYFQNSATEELKEYGDEERRLMAAFETAVDLGVEYAKAQWSDEGRIWNEDHELLRACRSS